MLAINTLAPFTLNSRLRPALLAAAAATGTTTADGKAVDGAAFVINVSAMEGKVKWGVHSLQREPETPRNSMMLMYVGWWHMGCSSIDTRRQTTLTRTWPRRR